MVINILEIMIVPVCSKGVRSLVSPSLQLFLKERQMLF